MYSRVITGAVNGIESMLAAVEVDASKGMPGFEMVRLPCKPARSHVSDFRRRNEIVHLLGNGG